MSLHKSYSSLTAKDTQASSPVAKKMNDSIPPLRIYLTTCLCLSFFALGLANSLLGPTAVHLTYLFETDIKSLSVSFTCGNIGYLLGSFLVGVVYDNFNAELQFTIATFITGIATVLFSWVPDLYYFYVAFTIQHFAMGYIDASGQSYVVTLWAGHRFKEPVMQTAHGVWSVGATICPFIIMPFLSELPEDDTEATSSNYTLLMNSSTNQYVEQTSSDQDTIELGFVRFSYTVVGIIISMLAICFGVGWYKQGISLRRKQDSSVKTSGQDSPENDITTNKAFTITILSLAFFFYFAYIWYEAIPGNFLSPFVIKGLGWDSHKGAIITSLYWGCHGLGRLVAIPVSMHVSAGKMLTWNLVFTTGAFICMLAIPIAGDALVWCSAAVAGFSMASTFASMILWMSNYIPITGKVGAVFLVGGSVGGSIGGFLAGYLFEEHSYMWMVYLSVLASVFDVIIYIALVVLVKSWKQDSSRTALEVKIEENQVELQHLNTTS